VIRTLTMAMRLAGLMSLEFRMPMNRIRMWGWPKYPSAPGGGGDDA
jgi:hypothetical protein